jgi:osmotically-inducible protein OsmY
MNRKVGLKLIPGLLFGIVMAGPAFAQSSTESATQSFKNAGHSTENAVSNAWHGTKTAVKDTDITAKIKIALHNDKLTKGQDIHIMTNGGVVTLAGHAPSEAAARAARIARDTTGVVSVTNAVRRGESESARD